MNLFKELDQLFAVPAQRKAWLVLVFSWILMFQCLYNILIGLRLAGLSGYDSLFDLAGSLDRFESSWLVAYLLQLISRGQLSFSAAIGAFWRAFADRPSFWLFVFCGVILLFSRGRKMVKVLCITAIGLTLGSVLTAAWVGLTADSVAAAMQMLVLFGLSIVLIQLLLGLLCVLLAFYAVMSIVQKMPA